MKPTEETLDAFWQGVNSMQPHQERVVEEKRELDEKATKLSDFIGNNPLFDNIDADEQERMMVENGLKKTFPKTTG